MRRAILLLLMLAMAFGSAPAAAKRVALVVGVDRYDNFKPEEQLKKAVNDARAIGATLQGLGYEVIAVENASRLDFLRQWQHFLNSIEPGDETAMFFAGHGVEIGGLNFLLPRDVPRFASGEDEVLKASSLSMTALLQQMRERKPQVSLYVLDACRDNPFAQPSGRGIGGTRGLARIDPPRGTFVMFSAGAGETALDRLSDDDPDPNSVYTRSLLQHLTEPGKNIADIARELKVEVRDLARRAAHVQTPAYYDEVVGDFCPAGCAAPSPGVAAAPTPPAPPSPVGDPAREAWKAAQNTESESVLEAFIARFGESFYAALARAKLAELKQKRDQVASVSPPPKAEPSSKVTQKAEPGATTVALPPGFAITKVPGQPQTASQTKGQDTKVAVVVPPKPVVAPEHKPGETFRDCTDCPEMVVVPAGTFMMGSPPKEEGRYDDEGPRHEVRIAAPFAVGKFEVTRDQFEAFVKDSGHGAGSKCFTYAEGRWEERSGRSYRNPGYKQGGNEPVTCINWNDAKAYAAWLSKKTGKDYRLPTEAEWEYAARAGSRLRLVSARTEGDLCDYANGADFTARETLHLPYQTVAACSDGYVHTAPVGDFAPNGFGLYDMQGNVLEWVEDCYNDRYAGAPADGSAWTSGADCSFRVLRGGSWISGPRGLRSANRFRVRPYWGYEFMGFRVARTL